LLCFNCFFILPLFRATYLLNKKRSKRRVLKKLPEIIKEKLKPLEPVIKNSEKIRYWCQDESRIGLITLQGKKITAKGIQPIGIEQLKYDYLWLYGLVEPKISP